MVLSTHSKDVPLNCNFCGSFLCHNRQQFLSRLPFNLLYQTGADILSKAKLAVLTGKGLAKLIFLLLKGAAKNSGSICASHPAAPGLILGLPKIFYC